MYSNVYIPNNNENAQFCTGIGYAGVSYPCLQSRTTYYALGSSQQLNNVVKI